MSAQVLADLDDPGLAVADGGSKAVRLARARRAGLPALPGFVVPTGLAARALAEGCATLRAGGSGAARLRVAEAPLGDDLVAALGEAGERLGGVLVARSSTPQEADPTWSGAFTSYLGIAPQDLPVAVRGCWASVFSTVALERAEAARKSVEAAAMAVLVQPEVVPDAGGTARCETDGRVTVTAVRGSPAPLLAGWEPGSLATVHSDGAIDSDGAVVDERLLAEVAALVRAVHQRLGDAVIEWAWADGRLVLLQTTPAAPTPPADAVPTLPSGLDVALCVRVARLVARFPATPELVLPWATALPVLPDPVAGLAAAPAEALAAARDLAGELTLQAWRDPTRAQAALAGLRALEPGATMALAATRQPDAELGGRLLGLLAAAQPALPVRRRVGPDPWGPFLFAVVRAAGEEVAGTPAAPGCGAGAAQGVHAGQATAPAGGRVLVADRPLPVLASLLWGARGLVTAGGSPGAHLLEVARSLGVPAVTGCRLDGRLGEHDLLAVDGNRGTVGVLPG